MFIHFLKDTNIRSRIDEISNQSVIGKIYSETVIEVEDQEYSGATLNGINIWYRDRNGWYYWSGMARKEVSATVPGPVGLPNLQTVADMENQVIAWLQPDSDFNFDFTSETIPDGETRIPVNLKP